MHEFTGGNGGRAEALTYTEIDFAGFEPVHVDSFHAWLLVYFE